VSADNYWSSPQDERAAQHNITERYIEAGWSVEQEAWAEDLPVETVRRMREDLSRANNEAQQLAYLRGTEQVSNS
jgi:hypothetical protein